MTLLVNACTCRVIRDVHYQQYARDSAQMQYYLEREYSLCNSKLVYHSMLNCQLTVGSWYIVYTWYDLTRFCHRDRHSRRGVGSLFGTKQGTHSF